ncbi:MAG: hypothetical protein GF344_00985 [Chitinivibrionales bacterium]|nr:hypothetical protein [Chitinivibrionales bacterium]
MMDKLSIEELQMMGIRGSFDSVSQNLSDSNIMLLQRPHGTAECIIGGA